MIYTVYIPTIYLYIKYAIERYTRRYGFIYTRCCGVFDERMELAGTEGPNSGSTMLASDSPVVNTAAGRDMHLDNIPPSYTNTVYLMEHGSLLLYTSMSR